METNLKLFAVCTPGLESILFQELISLGIAGKKVKGGVEFNGDLLTLYSANLWLRTASRILVRIGSFPLERLQGAEKKFAQYPWDLYLNKKTGTRIRVSCHKSKIYHSQALAQRLILGISQRLGRQIELIKDGKDSKSPLIFARVYKDRCTLSVDSSGEHLHKRGYKRLTTSAPIRENLAAAMLIASGYSGESPLVDPFCGSGTVLTEGVMLAAKIPPGRNRRFSFMNWKNFDKSLWQNILIHSEQFFTKPSHPVIGLDKDESAIIAATANIHASGLSDFILLKREDVLNFFPHNLPTGLIVTNPPYGKRTKENDGLMKFYSALGSHLREHFQGWTASILLPVRYPSLRRSLGMPLKNILEFSNGGIKVELLKGTL